MPQKFLNKKIFQSRILLLTGFFTLIFGFWLFPVGFFAKAQVGTYSMIIETSSPTRINAGDSSGINWNTTLNYEDQSGTRSVDPVSCEGWGSFQDEPIGMSGSVTVSPSATTIYTVFISCSVLLDPNYPDYGYTTVSGFASVRVAVGFNTINMTVRPAICQLGVNQPGDIPACPNNNYGNEGQSYCPADHPVACGTRTDSADGNLMNKILCCDLTQEAKDLGAGLTDPSYWIDARAQGGGMWCRNDNDLVVGGEWAKNNQLDFGYCRRLSGPIEVDEGFGTYDYSKKLAND